MVEDSRALVAGSILQATINASAVPYRTKVVTRSTTISSAVPNQIHLPSGETQAEADFAEQVRFEKELLPLQTHRPHGNQAADRWAQQWPSIASAALARWDQPEQHQDGRNRYHRTKDHDHEQDNPRIEEDIQATSRRWWPAGVSIHPRPGPPCLAYVRGHEAMGTTLSSRITDTLLTPWAALAIAAARASLGVR